MDVTNNAIAITNDHDFNLGRDMLDNFYFPARLLGENPQSSDGAS